MLHAKIPSGDLNKKWPAFQDQLKRLSPTAKNQYRVVVVGDSLAALATTLGLMEQGYHVTLFCRADSPRRICAQAGPCRLPGGNAFPDTAEAITEVIFQELTRQGDARSREADAYRLAQLTPKVIDFLQTMTGGGLIQTLGNDRVTLPDLRQAVLRRFYQQLLVAVQERRVEIKTFRDVLDICIIDGATVGVTSRDRRTGQIISHTAESVILATSGYSGMYDFALGPASREVSLLMNIFRRGAYLANPSFVQFHPLALVEPGRSRPTDLCCDAGLWDAESFRQPGTNSNALTSQKALRSILNRFGIDNEQEQIAASPIVLNLRELVPDRTQECCRRLLTEFENSSRGLTLDQILSGKQVYYPAAQYTLGGLWVNYHLMTSIRGLFAVGEANCSDLGAGSTDFCRFIHDLAQGLYVIPVTIEDYLSRNAPLHRDSTQYPEFKQIESAQEHKISRLLACQGEQPLSSFRQSLGEILRLGCGMIRSKTGLEVAVAKLSGLKERFWDTVAVSGTRSGINPVLETAIEVADELEFADVLLQDALARNESCGFHFRKDLVDEGLSGRDDKQYSYISAWEYRGVEKAAFLHKDALDHE